jgi:hypothetical protein
MTGVPDIRLPRLPDRNPVKLAVTVTPDLHRQLLDYAAFYEAAYGRAEPVADLVPAMLAAFLAADRSFARRQKRNDE